MRQAYSPAGYGDEPGCAVTTAGSDRLPGVDGATLRRIAAEMATGVGVVTTVVDGKQHGCAVNAVMSVSLAPPLMMVCLAHTSSTRPMISASGVFAINILPDTEPAREICAVFAGKRDEKFAEIGHAAGITGAPLLSDAVAWFECTTESTQELGDHTAFVGRVVAADRQEGNPLVFHRGRLASLKAAQ